MASEVRACRSCEGGIAWTCGGGPEDRRQFFACEQCGGSGEVRVYVYERRSS